MPLRTVRQEEFFLHGDEITHKPAGQSYRAYPGMPDIVEAVTTDVGDYREYEIRQMAGRLLAERLNKKA